MYHYHLSSLICLAVVKKGDYPEVLRMLCTAPCPNHRSFEPFVCEVQSHKTMSTNHHKGHLGNIGHFLLFNCCISIRVLFILIYVYRLVIVNTSCRFLIRT